MTAGDNRLTKHATPRATSGLTAAAAPTFPVSDLRVFLTALEKLGNSQMALLTAIGLDQGALDDPDRRISCEAMGALFSTVQRMRPIKNLALHLAVETPLGAYPLLDYLIVTSNTVGDGLRQFARYFQLVSAPIAIEIRENENPVRMIVSAPNNPFAVEYTTTLTVLNLRRETNDKIRAEYIALAHKPDDAAEMAELLGCRVQAGAAWSGLALSGEAWRMPFRRRDPVLRELLERQANEIVDRLPAGDPVVVDVRRALAKRVAGGDSRIDEVAQGLAMTARTLQRRLAAAGVSYQDLLEETRREAAEKYLAGSALSIAEVSYLLGYSEPSVLHRAFKRWKGMTPAAFRQSVRRAAGC
jgi:AraC-like DNA-binding protein